MYAGLVYPHAPRKCGALGGWKFHSIAFGAQTFCILSTSSWFRHLRSSLFAPTKFGSLALYILCDPKRRVVNLFSAIIKWYVERSSTSSRLRALVGMQTKKQLYTLASLRLSLIGIGPKKSTPGFLNTIPGSSRQVSHLLFLGLGCLKKTVVTLKLHAPHIPDDNGWSSILA